MFKFASGAIIAALLAAPAYAQLTPEQGEEVFCVATQLDTIKDPAVTEALAMVFIDDKMPAAAGKIAADALKPAVDGCKQRYTWADDVKGYATNIGLLGLSMDWLNAAAQDLKAPATLIQQRDAVFDGLTDAELDTLMLNQWQGDVAFKTKMRGLLMAQGVPDDDNAIDVATRLMSVIYAYGLETQRFISKRFPA